MSYISAKIIKELREKNQLTQRELADLLQVSDKTISKWETGRGLPDISFVSRLAEVFHVSVTELFMGEAISNENRAANLSKTHFYVCPVCGNVIYSIGKGTYSCCGILLPALEVEEDNNEMTDTEVEIVDNEYYVRANHSMSKEHFLSFAAYVTGNTVQLVKFYPEQEPECRFARRDHGFIYFYCNHHGLYRIRV